MSISQLAFQESQAVSKRLRSLDPDVLTSGRPSISASWTRLTQPSGDAIVCQTDELIRHAIGGVTYAGPQTTGAAGVHRAWNRRTAASARVRTTSFTPLDG
jgi:hypothetical protein